MARMDARAQDALRPVEILPHINKFAEGSCLIRWGNTHVLCTASVEERTPPHVPDGEGWVTAEYSMLPGQPGAQPPGHLQAQAGAPVGGDPAAGGPGPPAAVDSRKLGSGPSPSTAMYSGGRRHPDRLCDRGIRGPGPGVPEAHGGGVLREMPLTTQVAAVSAGIVDDVPPAGPVLRGGLRRHGGPQLRDDPGGGIWWSSRAPARPGLYHPGTASAGGPVRQGDSGASGHPGGGSGRRRPMKVVLASHNAKKITEMRAILSQMGVEVLSQRDVGVDLEPEETGTTFEANARIKAKAVMEATGCPPSPMTPALWWMPWTGRLGSIPPGTAAPAWTTPAGGSCC